MYLNASSRRAAHQSKRPTVPRHTRVAIALAVGNVLLTFGSANAANWEFAPRIEAGYRYNDNYRLELPGGEIEVSGLEADAAFTVRTVDPRTHFEVTPRVRATYFPDESEEDSTDYFLSSMFEDATPRRRTGIRAELSREDVVRSELLTADIGSGLGEPEIGDSGLSIERNRRDLMRFVPYFSYDLSQRYLLELQARYVDASYDRQIGGVHQDFTESGASVGLGFHTSERSRLLLRALGSRYETTFEANAYGGEAEWQTDFSPTSTMYLRLGAQQTEDRRGEKESDVIAGIGGRWASQRNRLFLDATRTVGAASAGTIVERHQLRMRLDHDISQRLTMQLGARAFRDESIDENSTFPTREYATAEAGFEWRVQRTFAITATYSYYWQEYEDEPSDASANAFLIGILYEPKRAN